VEEEEEEAEEAEGGDDGGGTGNRWRREEKRETQIERVVCSTFRVCIKGREQVGISDSQGQGLLSCDRESYILCCRLFAT